jgi:cytochrome P450
VRSIAIDWMLSKLILISSDGFVLPKGSNIAIAPFLMARDPKLWEDPLSFNPDRFGVDKPQMHPYLNVPFSAGPR